MAFCLEVLRPVASFNHFLHLPHPIPFSAHSPYIDAVKPSYSASTDTVSNIYICYITAIHHQVCIFATIFLHVRGTFEVTKGSTFFLPQPSTLRPPSPTHCIPDTEQSQLTLPLISRQRIRVMPTLPSHILPHLIVLLRIRQNLHIELHHTHALLIPQLP
jgi:hypothetical protein